MGRRDSSKALLLVLLFSFFCSNYMGHAMFRPDDMAEPLNKPRVASQRFATAALLQSSSSYFLHFSCVRSARWAFATSLVLHSALCNMSLVAIPLKKVFFGFFLHGLSRSLCCAHASCNKGHVAPDGSIRGTWGADDAVDILQSIGQLMRSISIIILFLCCYQGAEMDFRFSGQNFWKLSGYWKSRPHILLSQTWT